MPQEITGMQHAVAIDREEIVQVYKLLRPHVRRSPVIEVDGADFGLAGSQEWAARSGAMEVHAYDQIETLLGQGTVGLELEELDPGLDSLLVAVGGGGLIGGIAAWYAGRMRIIGVEPDAAPTLAMALEAGHP